MSRPTNRSARCSKAVAALACGGGAPAFLWRWPLGPGGRGVRSACAAILSGPVHDVRTPLTALFGIADSLVMRPPLRDAAPGTAAAIRDQVLRVGTRHGRLSSRHSKPAAGRAGGEPAPRMATGGGDQCQPQLLGPALAGKSGAHPAASTLPLLEFDAVLLGGCSAICLRTRPNYSPPGARSGSTR